MNILNALEIWAVIGPIGGVALGLHLPRKPREVRRLSPRRPMDDPLEGEGRDEFLVWKGGQFVPLDPPQFVPDGVNPTAAARTKSRADGFTYHTRRIGE